MLMASGESRKMNDNLEVVTVVRNKAMYEECIAGNPFLEKAVKHLCDNTIENKPIPFHYNRFLDSFDFGKSSWIMFCHEDFKVKCDVLDVLSKCGKDSFYGPIGARKKTLIPFSLCRWQMVGSIEEADKSGNCPHRIGDRVPFGTECDTFDCCCFLAHSSLIEKSGLRFDERMAFDLYVEDFCIQAKIEHGIKSRILTMPSVHKSSHDSIPGSYLSVLEIANRKWDGLAFAGTSSWIGGDVAGRYCKGIVYRVMKRVFGKGGKR